MASVCCRSLLLCLLAANAWSAAQIDVYHFDSDAQRQRYNNLIEEFRCPKCMNINIAGSDAPIAQDLRRTVHRLVVQEGYRDQQVRDFLQARYGDFVLYDPPFNARTWLVWVIPVLLVLVGLLVLVMQSSRHRNKRHSGDASATTLDGPEQARLRSLLDD